MTPAKKVILEGWPLVFGLIQDLLHLAVMLVESLAHAGVGNLLHTGCPGLHGCHAHWGLDVGAVLEDDALARGDCDACVVQLLHVLGGLLLKLL